MLVPTTCEKHISDKQLIPDQMNLSLYDFTHKRAVYMLLKCTFIEKSKLLRTLASGMCEINSLTGENSSISIVIPINITGFGATYEEAWDGVVSIDKRQQTHVIMYEGDSIIDYRQNSGGEDKLQELITAVYSSDENKLKLYNEFGYKKKVNVVENHPVALLVDLKVKLLPSIRIRSDAKKLFCIIVESDEKFIARGKYTQYLVMKTTKNYVFCVRNSQVASELGLFDVTNEVVKMTDNPELLLDFLINYGVDVYDNCLDDVVQTIDAEKLLRF